MAGSGNGSNSGHFKSKFYVFLHSMRPSYPTGSRDLCNFKEPGLRVRTTCFS